MANNRLPFGLCKKYGIDLPDDATPKDAWEALKENGIELTEDESDTVIDTAEVEKRNYSILQTDDGLVFSKTVSLSPLEWALYYESLAMFKRKYGENALKSGDIPPIEIGDKIIVSYGTFEKPRVVGIITRKTSYIFEEDDDE